MSLTIVYYLRIKIEAENASDAENAIVVLLLYGQ